MTLRKAMEHQVEQDEIQLAALRADLLCFEQRYGLSSEEFCARYQAGQAGDDADALEWNVIYTMHARLTEAVKTLHDQLRA